MKNLKLVMLLCLIATVAFGQKIVEKNFDYNGQYIEMNVPFASDIKVKTWDKQTVYFKADISTKDNKYIELYKLDIDESSSSITIESETKKLFEAFQDEWKKDKDRNKRYYYTNKRYDFNYVLYVPKNAKCKISSINGSMKAERIEGDFTADLINGNIDIDSHSGDLDLTTINGEIDLKVSNTKFVAETIHGDIYADESLSIVAHDRHVGQKVESDGGSFKNRLSLNTINGNMYLRK